MAIFGPLFVQLAYSDSITVVCVERYYATYVRELQERARRLVLQLDFEKNDGRLEEQETIHKTVVDQLRYTGKGQ